MKFALCLTFGMKFGVAGEMLNIAETFIDKRYHPTVICRAYNKALEDALADLDNIAMDIDVKHRATMLGLVKSCISAEFTSQFGDLIAARLDEDEVVRTTAYKHGTPLEGGKIAESEPVDFF